MRGSRYALTSVFIIAAATFWSGAYPVASARADDIDTSRLTSAITSGNLRNHLQALQRIARANGGNRAAGTRGYKDSGLYVRRHLLSAGYDVAVQHFDFTLFIETSPAEFTRVGGTPYVNGEDFLTLDYSGSGDITGTIVPTNGIVIPPSEDPSSASGCDEADFPAGTAGNIALIQRGTCDFTVKVANAAAAGAVAAIIFNEGNPDYPDRVGLLGGTLGEPAAIPAISISYALGKRLYDGAQSRPVSYRIAVTAQYPTTSTFNVIGTSRSGDPRQAIVVGAHLDSVDDGPGINDNGSGTAVVLEIAKKMAELRIETKRQLRFAFWGAEEEGLFGSQYYVDNLSESELDRIVLNLNFDMLASPNYARFIYDGDGSDSEPGLDGSDQIERVFARYFRQQGLATQPTAFDGRSDYGPFIAVGIAAGGLFSGAEEVKTKYQVKLYGGKAGIPFDKCYHEPCDTTSNVNYRAIIELGRGAAHSVMTMAQRTDPFVRSSGKSVAALVKGFKYRGSKLIK